METVPGSTRDATDIAIVGAGSIGIAVAYYLMKDFRLRNVILIDPRDPMSLTSAQSGENYRNWWPDPTMTAFTDHSTDLMEGIACASNNRINMTRRGYVLATRRQRPSDLIDGLFASYGARDRSLVRIHTSGAAYEPTSSPDWTSAPDGVDVLAGPALIRHAFPYLPPDIATVLHVRRAGSIDGQQLGQIMLEAIRAAGGRLIRGKVCAIANGRPFRLLVQTCDGHREIEADRVVNAAGPFAAEVQAMMGEELPISCVYQQKISFEDTLGAILRTMPFTIDLDAQQLDWSDEERAILADDPSTAKLLNPMAGGVHCRPDGPQNGKWIKLGWAFNDRATDPGDDEPSDPYFPEIVLRAASRLYPGLRSYVGRLPRNAHHYGGYYAMTPENLPLIGPARTKGAFLAAALSGFGTMAACAAGAICASWIAEAPTPAFAPQLSLARYDDPRRMSDMAANAALSVL